MKLLDNKEYLTYDEIAAKYNYARSSLVTLASRKCFTPIKFKGDVKKYVEKDEFEAYAYGTKQVTKSIPSSDSINEEVVSQETPFPISTTNSTQVEALRLYQQTLTQELNHLQETISQEMGKFREMITPLLQPV